MIACDFYWLISFPKRGNEWRGCKNLELFLAVEQAAVHNLSFLLGVCSLGKNVFISIPLVIFQGSLLRGSTDRVRQWGPWTGGQCFRVTPESFEAFGFRDETQSTRFWYSFSIWKKLVHVALDNEVIWLIEQGTALQMVCHMYLHR